MFGLGSQMSGQNTERTGREANLFKHQEMSPDDLEVLQLLGPGYSIKKEGALKYLMRDGRRIWAGCNRLYVESGDVRGETGVTNELIVKAKEKTGDEEIRKNKPESVLPE